ncbi:MAG: glycine cleavage system aminomethyltransferase GcvT [Pseudomonadota bacterium]
MTTETLERTPLHALHRDLGARLVPFAGYEMPVQFPAGIMKEHLHTREKAGLFDVSHMGQIRLSSRSGAIEDTARALETLVPADILGLAAGRQRYALFTNDAGGIEDDLMIANHGDALFLVVNAARKAADSAHLTATLSDHCKIEVLEDRALLALQGPAAEDALATQIPAVRDMRFMDSRVLPFGDGRALVSRSGYTGEDGFEVSVPADAAEAFARRLFAHPDVEPIGLGARDSLRLEAGLCLHGQDIDASTTPVSAGLNWAIPKIRRSGGARAGGFPGANVVLSETPALRRTGILPDGRAPVRAGTPLHAEPDGPAIGHVTSGGFGPSCGHPVAMGYVPANLATPGTPLLAQVRGKFLTAATAALPFITPTYKR